MYVITCIRGIVTAVRIPKIKRDCLNMNILFEENFREIDLLMEYIVLELFMP